MSSPTFRKIDFNRLEDVTQELQSVHKRDSTVYRDTVLGIARSLNGFQRGTITKIDVNELKDQIGHLLYYEVKEVDHPIPFDIEYVPPLLSHFKNPTVIVLRRIRRFLMASHRKILARLEEEQALERRIDFADLDVNHRVKKGLEEMQRCQTLCRLAKTVTRKLDILTKALHIPALSHSHFGLLRRLLADPHHLRNREAVRWLEDSSFGGNLRLLGNLIDKGLSILDDKSNEIFAEMERLSGIPFERDTKNLDANFNWYSLGTPLRRGEEFVRIFENEEVVENKIKRLTYFMVRATWDAGYFRNLLEEYQPNPRELQAKCTLLARLYFELEEKISESTKTDGEVRTAIRTDLRLELLSEKEGREAEDWVLQNKARLQELKLEVFKLISDTKKTYPDVALPEKLEALLTPEEEGAEEVDRGSMPKFTILDLHHEVEGLEERTPHPDGELLVDLCLLRQKIMERRGILDQVSFQRAVRRAVANFAEYEAKLLELNQAETRLDEMRLTCEQWITDCFREVEYVQVSREILEQAFEVVVDKMLYGIKTLDYDVIDAERFQDYFDKALLLDDQQTLFHLDWLLHEIHIIPRQDQLIHALADWENSLGKSAYQQKQEFILENEIELQKLVDDVRAELRERIGHTEIKPRRLRFEIFSLADCYAGNLRSLLDGLLRMAGVVASEHEGERLIANIQAIESQIIEAQRITKPKGEAYKKLKELERLELFPHEVVQDLYLDLKENFQELDQLLKDTNKGLERVRTLQNRFGGDFDTTHLSVIINIHDLEDLKGIYHFVDNITIMDMKRFGIVYKQRYALMEDLFERAHQKDPTVPKEIAKAITKKVYKLFKKHRNVPLALKIAIFKEVPEILEFESQLLIRTLNFVSGTHIRNKAVYRAILRILEDVKTAGRTRRMILRRIWIKLRGNALAYKPRNYKKNYENNVHALTTDARNIIGNRFEDL